MSQINFVQHRLFVIFCHNFNIFISCTFDCVCHQIKKFTW